MFLSLRAGDAVSIAAGLWFVPRFVTTAEIGAVLPVTSFATFLSLPLFALAMTAMKETASLAAAGDTGRIKSLLRGIFVCVGLAVAAILAVAWLATPRFMRAMGVADHAAGLLAVAAALLGCAAPVYTDALQAMKRFRALGAVEASGAVVRFIVMAAAMPLRPLAGYFAGAAALPAFRMAASVALLRHDLQVRAAPFWTARTVRRMTFAFGAILAYQAFPMGAALVEQSVLRTSLVAADSAAYFMVSRFSDMLYYVTTPLLLVVFPYSAQAAHAGENTAHYALKCCMATLLAACGLAAAYAFYGPSLLALMPNGAENAAYARWMPLLVATTALTTCQVFITNIEVSAGRFSFLRWLIPLHIAYPLLLWMARPGTLGEMLMWFFAASAARFAFAAASVSHGQRRIAAANAPSQSVS